MGEIQRTFTIPHALTADQTARLEPAFVALQARQHHLSNITPRAAAARSVDVHRDAVTLSYEVAEAEPLTTWIGSAIPEERVQTWARSALTTLAAAYPAGQVALLRHGGLSSDGMLLHADDSVTILDFGVAECFASALDPSDESWLQQVAPAVAPEVWSSPSSFGPQADIFSLGVLLFELVTGTHPFGADRADPDDCKYQTLTQMPAAIGSVVSSHFAAMISRAIRSDPRERFESFEDMLRALDDRTADAPASSVPTPVAEPPEDHASSEDEAARRRYLEEQAQLKQDREAQEERRAEQSLKRQRWFTSMRRHATALTVAAIVLITAGAVITGLWIRRSNAADVQSTFTRIALEMSTDLMKGDFDALSRRLELGPPIAPLKIAVEDMHRLPSPAKVEFGQITFTDPMRHSGHFELKIHQAALDVGFSASEERVSGYNLEIEQRELADLIRSAADDLALSMLGANETELMQRIRTAVEATASAAQAERVLAELAGTPRARVLEYLGYHGETDTLRIGAFRPDPARGLVRAEVVLARREESGVFSTPPVLELKYTCSAECTLSAINVDPPTEPDAHQAWCLASSIDEVQAAFKAGDATRVAELVAADVSTVSAALTWIPDCREVTLSFGSPNASREVFATVDYQPGILSDMRLSSTKRLGFRIDPDGWTLRATRSTTWPGPPAGLRRQQLGRQLVDSMKDAWTNGDAEKYAALFAGTTRAVRDIRSMFERFNAEGTTIRVEPQESPDSARILRLALALLPGKNADASEYVEKTFTFSLENDRLNWNGAGDPVWVFAGQQSGAFTSRLQNATWEHIPALREEFDRIAMTDFSADERKTIADWLLALNATGALFTPTTEQNVAGFPTEVRLTNHPDEALRFRLVVAPSDALGILYIQDRETRVTDLSGYWQNADSPWTRWSALMESPPDGQAVGLTLTEAQQFAGHYGCQIPTLAEWRAAAEYLGDGPTQPGVHRFHGGVWEFCRDSHTTGQGATVVGGCWYDYDPQSDEASETTLVARQVKFGTVGFRLAKRIDAPDVVTTQVRAAQADPTTSR
jgi:hypothetical protein